LIGCPAAEPVLQAIGKRKRHRHNAPAMSMGTNLHPLDGPIA
jgi:hypothetical protein